MNDLERLVDMLSEEIYEINLNVDDHIYVTVRKEERNESPETSLNILSKEGEIFLLLFTAYPSFEQTKMNLKKLESSQIDLVYEGPGEAEEVRIDQSSEVIKIYHHLETITDEEILREQLRSAFQMGYSNQAEDRKLLINGLNKNLDKRMIESYEVIVDALSSLVGNLVSEFNKKHKEKTDSEVSMLTEHLRKLGNLSSPDFVRSSLEKQLGKHSVMYLAWSVIAEKSQEFSKVLAEDAQYLKENGDHVLSKKAKKLSTFYTEIAKMAIPTTKKMKSFLEKETELYKTIHGVELNTLPIEQIKEELMKKTK